MTLNQHQYQPKHIFGADERLDCPQCEMFVSRRTPHPMYGNTLEIQMFSCRSCNHEEIRNAGQSGETYRC
jgi:hypothetical protein